ncbi:MAG: hypothetical protein ACO27H_09900 [Burkholderiaceae bacterium]
MCNANVMKTAGTVAGFALGGPVGAAIGNYAGRKTAKALTPDMPVLPIPPSAQDEKAPDASALLRRRRTTPSTLLTGPAGVTASALTTGAPTLLGG